MPSPIFLITGATGYLGGRIARDLARHSASTLRLTTRCPPAVRPDWLAAGDFVRLDVTDDESCDQACHGVDTVVHLAAMNEIDCADDPVGAAEVNGVGTWRLVQSAMRHGVHRFVYFSTAHVYGSPLTGTITERTLPRPANAYASSHHFGEEAVLCAHDARKCSGVVLRLSNAVGAAADADVNRWTLLVNDLCRGAVRDGRLVLRSSGLAQRDWIPLAEVCRAVRHILTLSPASVGDGLFNLGAGEASSVLQVAELVADRCEVVLGHRPTIERPPPAPNESGARLNFSVEKLRETGFSPQGDLAAEIDATLTMCRQICDAS